MPKLAIVRRSILWLVMVGAGGMVYYHLALFVPRAMQVRAEQGFGKGPSQKTWLCQDRQ